MKITQSQNNLNREKFDLILIKSFDLLQMLKELTSAYVKQKVHFDDKWMVYF
jgi:spore coat polysaccharide biosynthesis predicted glycosyltransferase SpsG